MMLRLLNPRRLAALAMIACAAPALHAPLRAQTPPGSSSAGQRAFRVIVQDLANKTDPKSTRWGAKTSELIRQGLSKMSTHTAIPAKEVAAELKKLNVLPQNFDCTTARQLQSRIDAQVVMCGEYTVEGSSYKVSASFYTLEEAISYDVLPFTASSEAEAANKIVTEFQTYVHQLQLVTYCQTNVQSEQWQEALNQCTQALQLNPKSTPSLYYRATALLKLGQPDSALAGYQRVLDINPINQEAMRSAGTVAATLGKSDLAAKYYHDYLELNPGDDAVRLTIANDLNKAGDAVAAAKLLEDGLKGDTTNFAMMGAVGNYWMVAGSNVAKSMATATDEEKAQAKIYYTNALKYYEIIQRNIASAKLDPTSLDNLYRYMMQAYLYSGSPERAAAITAPAAANDSATAGTYSVIAAVQSATGHQADAIASLNKAASKDPTLKVGYQMALLSLSSGNLDDIVKYARQAATEGATDDQMDAIAIQLIAEGAKKEGSDRNAWLEAGRSIGKGDKPAAMANFYQGQALYSQAAAMIPKPPKVLSKADARTALALLQRARPLIANSSAFTEAAGPRAQFLNGIDQTVTYLNQVLKQTQ